MQTLRESGALQLSIPNPRQNIAKHRSANATAGLQQNYLNGVDQVTISRGCAENAKSRSQIALGELYIET